MTSAAQDLFPLSFGWYGKLKSRGDFVGRGLPRVWLRQWDTWLERAMFLAKMDLGETPWRERLAALPASQWLARPLRAGEPAWCGVLVGSADRVGRVFPLLVAESFAWPAFGAVDVGELRARGRTIATWLQTAKHLDPKQLEASAAPFAARPLHCPAADDTRPGIDVQNMCMSHPEAGSFWWPSTTGVDPLPQPWPPTDGWLRRLLEGDEHRP